MFMFNSSRDQCTNKAKENKTIFRACLSLLIIRSQFVYQAKNGFGFQLVGEWGPFLDTFRPFSSITMKRQYKKYFEIQERNRIFKPSVLEASCTIVEKGPVQRPCLSLHFHILLFTLNCNWNMDARGRLVQSENRVRRQVLINDERLLTGWYREVRLR